MPNGSEKCPNKELLIVNAHVCHANDYIDLDSCKNDYCCLETALPWRRNKRPSEASRITNTATVFHLDERFDAASINIWVS